MRIFTTLLLAIMALLTPAGWAAEKPAAKPADKSAKADPKAGEKAKDTKPAPLGDLPPPPPRLSFQGIKGAPGVAIYDNLQGKVPADKAEIVAKALADAKLPGLIGLYSTLRNDHEAAEKALEEAAMLDKDYERDKAKLDKAEAEADRTKNNYRLRFDHAKANKDVTNAKDDLEHTTAVKKKREEAAKVATDAYAAAKAAYDKALGEAQPSLDVFRREGGIPAAK